MICQNLQNKINELQEKQNLYCGNKNTNESICVKLSYDVWSLQIQKRNICQNNLK